MDDRLRRAVAARLPGLALECVRRLGEGQENVAYEIDGSLIVRFTKNADRSIVERRLGEFLAAMHAIPVQELAAVVELDTQPLPGWLADARDEYVAVVDHVPTGYRPTIEAFLTAPPLSVRQYGVLAQRPRSCRAEVVPSLRQVELDAVVHPTDSVPVSGHRLG